MKLIWIKEVTWNKIIIWLTNRTSTDKKKWWKQHPTTPDNTRQNRKTHKINMLKEQNAHFCCCTFHSDTWNGKKHGMQDMNPSNTKLHQIKSDTTTRSKLFENQPTQSNNQRCHHKVTMSTTVGDNSRKSQYTI